MRSLRARSSKTRIYEAKEKRDAKDYKGRQTVSSGRKDEKGDGYNSNFCWDSKTTVHHSYSLRADVWRKISKEAAEKNLDPALSIELVEDVIEVVVVSRNAFIELTSLASNAKSSDGKVTGIVDKVGTLFDGFKRTRCKFTKPCILCSSAECAAQNLIKYLQKELLK